MSNDFKKICPNCGKEYSCYPRNIILRKNRKDTEMCLDCIKELLKNEKYHYHNYVPCVIDSADVIYKIYNSKEELLEGIKSELNSEGDNIFIDGNNIVKVYGNEEKGYLQGYVSCEIDLPKYNNYLNN